MNFIIAEILNVVKAYNVKAFPLNEKESVVLIDNIYSNFTAVKNRIPLWENLLDIKTYRSNDGWKYVSDFIGNSSTMLFLDPAEGAFGVNIKDGENLNLLLENSFGFVFYLTNTELDYLICFNDHDVLIGCGDAKDWIEKLR